MYASMHCAGEESPARKAPTPPSAIADHTRLPLDQNGTLAPLSSRAAPAPPCGSTNTVVMRCGAGGFVSRSSPSCQYFGSDQRPTVRTVNVVESAIALLTRHFLCAPRRIRTSVFSLKTRDRYRCIASMLNSSDYDMLWLWSRRVRRQEWIIRVPGRRSRRGFPMTRHAASTSSGCAGLMGSSALSAPLGMRG